VRKRQRLSRPFDVGNAVLLTLAVFASCCQAAVTLYPAPDGASSAADFRVTVDGREIFVYDSQVAAFAYFSFAGTCRVAVTVDHDFTQVEIRPKHRGISYSRDGRTIRFVLDRPCHLSIELDGNLQRPLFLFADPPERDVPQPGDAGVHYFDPGRIHEAGEIVLQSRETLYIAGGAIVRGYVRADNAENVRILGRGILDATGRDFKTNMVRLSRCRDVEVRGIIVLDAFGWTLVPMKSQDVAIANVKLVSWRDNDDGIDIVGCRNLTVRNCFIRTKDDCIAVKASPGYFEDAESGLQDVTGVIVSDTVLWNAQWGNAVEIGFELQTPSVRDLVFRDCDIIHVESGGVFTIHNGDFATVENVRYENIRVEDPRDKLIELRIGLSIYSGDCPEAYQRRNPDRQRSPLGQWMPVSEQERDRYSARRGRIRNLCFTDIDVTARKMPRSYIIGYDEGEHCVQDVTIENMRINGRTVADAAEGGFTVENARDIRFRR
jgi:hypothetical protein